MKFIERISQQKEHLNILSGEIFISKIDGVIESKKDIVLSPGKEIILPFMDETLKEYPSDRWELTVRSGLAQSGLTIDRDAFVANQKEVKIVNLHPKNSYLIPDGLTQLGRLYLPSQTSVTGENLDQIMLQIQSLDNNFSQSDISRSGDSILEIKFLKDFSYNPGAYSKNKPINIRDLPSGVHRWKIKNKLGTIGITDREKIKEDNNKSGLRLLLTPYFTVPEDIILVIQNSDSLESRIIDSSFAHLIVGEFHDNLLKNDAERTENSVHLKAYKRRKT